ncbi:hypothetical protein M2262_002415 [Pseudomonas sp. BIGb0408]|uniref:Uncharacterized protein n=1 Tax=Phytopseudomonas flavescens TaxID=29435 RepID=A0A7Y9XKJ4_9GAMM|nr:MULTISPECIES: hypothetical protein [Pseudomonas]MCW2292365.1 hypothetical protein [Pseudomonas sp. BIGb0408]NYH73063.1 hypothetical protein [Pseudomonas flavescens]
MRNVLVGALVAVIIAGCGQIPSVPEYGARSKWNGRSAAEAIEFFGAPDEMKPVGEGQAVLIWSRDTSYWRTRQTGRTTDVQGGVRVNTTYYEDYIQDSGCRVSIFVNKQKTITNLDLSGHNCAGVNVGE